jgi:polysaccharide deacetylase family protein (PEP-CTERM system associated)
MEEWFHLLDCEAIPGVDIWDGLESRIGPNTDRLLALLSTRGIKATFFCLGWVAEKHPSLLRRVAEAGHEIGCHSGVHSLIHQQSPGEFLEETRRAIGAITQCIGSPVTAYRAPGFSLTAQTLWAFDHLAELGITQDCSIFPGRHAHGGTGGRFPSGPFRIRCAGGKEIREIPMSLVSLGPLDIAFAGGGYFRFLPYPLIAQWTRTRPATMTYFHPRDFDPGQPRLPGLPLVRQFKAYAGLNGAYKKLGRFLEDFGGQSLGEATAHIDWDRTPLVQL